jgi:hypothetical protein
LEVLPVALEVLPKHCQHTESNKAKGDL